MQEKFRLRARREAYHVPSMFVAEVTNVLVSLERRKVLSSQGATAAADVLNRLDPIVHPDRLGIADLRLLAQRYQLSAYDALYLSLAIDEKLPMACGDRHLKKALAAAGVRLI